MEKFNLKIFKENEKLLEAYNLLSEKINNISEQYQLTYFELFGIIECIKCEIIKENIKD